MEVIERVSIKRFYINRLIYFAIVFSIIVGILAAIIVFFVLTFSNLGYSPIKYSLRALWVYGIASGSIIVIFGLIYNMVAHLGASLHVGLIEFDEINK